MKIETEIYLLLEYSKLFILAICFIGLMSVQSVSN